MRLKFEIIKITYMKKIIFAAFAALFTLGMVSCQGNGDEPEKKSTIVLTVDSVGQDDLVFSVSPSDTLALYYVDAKPRSIVVNKTTEELVNDFKAGMDVVIAMGADLGLTYTYADFCWHGEHRLHMNRLTPATDYVLYVYYLDTLTAQPIGDVCSVPFRTKEIEILGEKDVHMTEVDFQWDEEGNFWSIGAEDAEKNYDLLIFSQKNSPKTGTFTIANGDILNTFFLVGGGQEGKLYEFVELTVVIKALEDDLYQIAIDGVVSDGYRYHITMDPVPLVPISDLPDAPARKAPCRAIKVLK